MLYTGLMGTGIAHAFASSGFSTVLVDSNEAAAAKAAGKDEHWYDVQTKFDLAKAYQEMGDRDGAREILQAVGPGIAVLVIGNTADGERAGQGGACVGPRGREAAEAQPVERDGDRAPVVELDPVRRAPNAIGGDALVAGQRFIQQEAAPALSRRGCLRACEQLLELVRVDADGLGGRGAGSPTPHTHYERPSIQTH